VLAYLMLVAIDLVYPEVSEGPVITVSRLLRSVQAWGAIVGLLGFARLHLNRDHPARAYMTEAVFPYYIAHQTIIVVVGYALTRSALGAGWEFGILLVTTLVGCALFYEVGRRLRWLRPLIGLKLHAQTSP